VLASASGAAERNLREDVSDVVVLARPEGLEHAPPTFVVDGVDALVEVLRAA